jgi:hypothetical protein
MTSDTSTGQKKSPFDKKPAQDNRKIKEEVKNQLQAKGVGKEKIPRGIQEKAATAAVQKARTNRDAPSEKTPVGRTPDASAKVVTNANPTAVVPTATKKEDWMVGLTDWDSVGTYLGDLKQKAEALEKSNPKLSGTLIGPYYDTEAAFTDLSLADQGRDEFVGGLLKTLKNLIDKADSNVSSAKTLEKTRADRIKANQGEGRYPVGTVEKGAMVVLNRVEPPTTGIRYVVWLQHHQNKHQAPSARIPELGVWKSAAGDRFPNYKGLEWHKTNTAVWVFNWLVDHSDEIIKKKGGDVTPDKTVTKDDDDVTYDLTAWLEEEGVITGSYHCNPAKDFND